MQFPEDWKTDPHQNTDILKLSVLYDDTTKNESIRIEFFDNLELPGINGIASKKAIEHKDNLIILLETLIKMVKDETIFLDKEKN